MELDNVSDIFPLTPTQKGMLFHAIAEPESDAYVNQVVFDVRGRYDRRRLETNIREAITHHEALRTVFVWEVADDPVQVVMTQCPPELIEFDWTGLPAEQLRIKLLDWVASEKSRGFDIGAAPLTRFMSAQLDSDRWQLGISFHHIVLDGWSVNSLAKQLLADAPSQFIQPFRFRDFVTWQQRQDTNAAADYWQRILANAKPNELAIPDASRITKRHCQTEHTIDVEMTSQLTAAARDGRVTLNSLFQAAWSVVLNRYTGGATDIVFGVTSAGRPLELPGIDSALGSFINTLPCRICIDAGQTVRHWLKAIQTQQAEALNWSFASLADVQRMTNADAKTPLFQSILVFENYPVTAQQESTFAVTAVEHFEASNYPLALIVVPGDDIRLFLVYDDGAFPHSMAEDLLAQLVWSLEALTQSADANVESLLTLAPGLRKQLAGACHTLPSATIDTRLDRLPVHERILKTAANRPDATAVHCGEQRVTYAQLIDQSARIAHSLGKAGVQPGDRVAVLVERSIETVSAILGVMRAGAAYVPLDKLYPPEHIRFVLEDASVAAMLTTHHDARGLQHSPVKSIDIHDVLSESKQVSFTDAAIELDSPAYLIYTSGSTGRPKGVVVSHGNLLFSTAARSQVYPAPPTSFLLLSSFAFDSSVAGIFWTLSNGGTLQLPPSGGEQDTRVLAEIIATHHVTHLLCLPTLYDVLLSDLPTEAWNSFQVGIVAGEAVGSQVVRRHQRTIGHAKLFNEYGPTEATVWATVYEMPPNFEGDHVPIGRPIPGADVRLLGADGRPVPPGCLGELYIGGAGVTAGYWNQPSLTQQRFVEFSTDGADSATYYRTGDLAYLREDGQLMFSGRVDRQVKLRGYRIELAAIEHHLMQHPDVSEAAVVVRKFSGQAEQIVAFLTGSQSPDDVLTDLISNRLPQYMVPSSFVWLPTFPRLANGKVDTKQLLAFEAPTTRRVYQPPSGRLEKTLHGIWQDILNVDEISADDDFFALGGDSIVSIQVISRARREGIELQPAQLARHPNIRALAAAATLAASELGTNKGSATCALSPIQRWFFAQSFENPHHWNQSQLFEVRSSTEPESLKRAIEAAAAAHPLLRSVLREENGRLELRLSGQPVQLETMPALEEQTLQEQIASIQRSLHLQNGPLCRFVQITNEGRSLLLVAVHHLVIDVVSWQIIVDDIEFLYERYANGRPTELPAGCSFSTWTQSQEADDRKYRGQAEFWSNSTRDMPTAPFPDVTSPIREELLQTRRLTIADQPVESLRSAALTAYNTKPHELLITAIGLSVSDVTDTTNIALMLEAHGRNHETLDLARTVGWFTSLYPIRLQMNRNDIGHSIRATKDCIRSVPDDGAGYGYLKYAMDQTANDSATPIDFAATPQILFNYLGYQANAKDPLLRPIEGATASSRDPRNTREHLLEIVASMDDAGLHVDFTFPETLIDDSIVDRLIASFETHLHAVLSHCMGQRAGFTPTDFPESALSQTELDDLLDELD